MHKFILLSLILKFHCSCDGDQVQEQEVEDEDAQKDSFPFF